MFRNNQRNKFKKEGEKMNQYECPHCGSVDIEKKEDIFICYDCEKWFTEEDAVLDDYEPIEGIDF